MAATSVTGALPTVDPTGAVPNQTLRDFDRRSGQLTYRERHAGPFYNEIKGRGKKRAVTDYDYDHYETEDYQRDGIMYGDDGTGAGTTTVAVGTIYFKITGASGFLQANDTLHVSPTQLTQTNTTTPPYGETMVVRDVDSTIVTVDRKGGAGTASTNVTTAASTANHLYFSKGAPISRENSTRRTSQANTVAADRQFIQTIRESCDFSVEMLATLMKIDEKARLKRTKLAAINKNIDMQFWIGDQSFFYEGGYPKRSMGGIFFYLGGAWGNTADTKVNAWSSTYDLVTGDGTSRIYKASQTLTETMLWKFFEMALIHGSLENKVGWCGPSFPTELQILLGSKLRIENGVTKYGTQVMKWIHPALPTPLPLIVERNWYKQYDTDLVILDMDTIEYNYVVWKGPAPFVGPSDLREITYPGSDGQMAELNEYVAALAINPMAKCNHSWMTAVTKTSIS